MKRSMLIFAVTALGAIGCGEPNVCSRALNHYRDCTASDTPSGSLQCDADLARQSEGILSLSCEALTAGKSDWIDRFCEAVGCAKIADTGILVCGHPETQGCKTLWGAQHLDLAKHRWSGVEDSLDDSISSFSLPSGWEATFCLETNLGGPCISYEASVPQWPVVLPPNYRHAISSFEFRRTATLWDSFVEEAAFPSNSTNAWSEEAQGITHDESHWYVTDRWTIRKFQMEQSLDSAKGVLSVGLPGDGCNHFGDITFYDRQLWAPLEGCNDYARIYVYDEALRQLRFARLTTQRKTSWVAINPTNGLMYTSDNKDVSHREIKVYPRFFSDGEALTPLYTIELDRPLVTIQGGVFSAQGNLYLTSSGDPAGIHVFHIEGRKATRVRHIAPKGANSGFPYYDEVEGITLWDLDHEDISAKGQIHWILLNNNALNDQVSLRHVSVDYPARL